MLNTIKQEIESDPLVMGYAAYFPDAPGQVVNLLNQPTFTMAKSRFITARTILAESGTTATDESDLYFLGVVPVNSSSTTHRRLFSLASAFGGRLPAKSKIVFKNDMGVAVTSAAVTTSVCVDTIS